MESITETMERLRSFRDDRGWGIDHTPRNLAEAVSIESAELLELFQWGDEPRIQAIECEVADVMIYCLNLCLTCGIDPLEIIHAKIDRNEKKYARP